MSSKLLKYSAYIFKKKNNFLFFPKTLKQFLGWKFSLAFASLSPMPYTVARIPPP